jgi:hypothetical protein
MIRWILKQVDGQSSKSLLPASREVLVAVGSWPQQLSGPAHLSSAVEAAPPPPRRFAPSEPRTRHPTRVLHRPHHLDFATTSIPLLPFRLGAHEEEVLGESGRCAEVGGPVVA